MALVPFRYLFCVWSTVLFVSMWDMLRKESVLEISGSVVTGANMNKLLPTPNIQMLDEYIAEGRHLVSACLRMPGFNSEL